MSRPCIYLDHAAATPMDPQVLKAMQPYFSEKFHNPSATYLAAREVGHDLSAAREHVARWFGAKPSEIFFTAGGTEANNVAIHGVMRRFPVARVLTSAIEHDSVLLPAKQYPHEVIPVDQAGIIDTEELERLISDETVLISVMYANNEVGTIQPLRTVSRIVEGVRQARKRSGNQMPLYVHVDACQAAGYLDLHVSRLGVDLMTINAGKIHGPKQSGVLFVKSPIALQPIINGGGQEQGVRSGTENVAACVGLAKALDLVQANRNTEVSRLQKLQKTAFETLRTEIPEIIINGSLTSRLPNNIHFSIPGQDNERIIMALDEEGILCAAGSACSASSDEPSHVLKAMGISDELAQSSVRMTMGRDTTLSDIRHMVTVLKRSLQ